MRTIALAIALLTLSPTPEQSYESLKRQAESSYSEKSYGRAHELYEQIAALSLPAEEKRWVDFRLADTAWRADASNRDAARKQLEELIRDYHDRVSAEAEESLGDFGDQPHYLAALEWWASSSDIDDARRRYLLIAFRMTSAPRDVLANAMSIAQTTEDRDHARFLLAQQLGNEYTPEPGERALELLDAIIADGKQASEWYDDALMIEAARLTQPGRPEVNEDGSVTFKPDYTKALELYRRLLTEFTASETRFYQQAQRAAEQIDEPSVTVGTAMTFLPQSEQQLLLAWRNVRQVSLSLTPVDLVDDVRLSVNRNWTDGITTSGHAPIRRWTYDTNDRGDHAPSNAQIRITPKLAPGAYVVEASASDKSSRQLVLVTDANIVMHQAGGRSDLFVCDAETGQPIAGARLRVWQQRDRDMTSIHAVTDANGFATARNSSESGGMLFVAASAPDNRQAWLNTWSYGGYADRDAEWRIYAFTDRPAYRPEETVRWKFIARMRRDNEWITPSRGTIDYEIHGPRGEKVASGKATLNEFGSFWSDLPLKPSMPLGSYAITFHKTTDHNEVVGNAQLFRLEEYKLPEFRVDVHTPPGKQYRLGDTVEATIETSYYFGGPVANASVQVVVHAQPFFRYWFPWREYDWYYAQSRPRYYEYGGQEILNLTVHTDGEGRAVVRVPTQRDSGDAELHIEARVTDSSRREVAGEGVVRVTKQRYSVIAHPDHVLLRPNDKVSIAFKVSDPNERPVQVTGTVKVIRRHWLRTDYRDDDVRTSTLTTDKDGVATMSFTPSGDGYYEIQWSSIDSGTGARRVRDVINAQTAVWVSRTATSDIGYRSGALEIILDKESFRAGQTAAVMLAARDSGRWVMLTTSANGILETQIVHLDGTVKLVQIPVTDKHVPSFYVTASSVSDRTLVRAVQRIVVPPVEHFITVHVKADREQYEPRQIATLLVKTSDVDGRPVAAEVAVGVSDESVTAIQSELAGDPRQFFFGSDRSYAVNAPASVQLQQYALLVEENGKLIDDRARNEKKDQLLDRDAYSGVEAGIVGGRAGSVAEAITVTAEAPAMLQASPPPARDMVANLQKAKAGGIEVHVRSDFSSTAFWKPDVVTGPDGLARVSFKFPESLTTWRATARAVTPATQVGMGSSTAKTNMPLMVRLQAPRFFVAGDRATISAIINNNSNEPMTVTSQIEVEGVTLENRQPTTENRRVIPPHGESRADWIVAAEHAGTAKLRVSGRSASRGDAMEKTFTVYEHGIDKLIARSGKLRGSEAVVKLDLPHERRDTALTVQVQPSLAVTMLDALPYLIDYPYGCTEQTMSRFLPAAIVARTLAKNGLHIPRTGKLGELDEVTARSMARLYDFQHADGGWGWWKQGDSDDFMTAYVVWGFAVAREGGLDVDGNAVRRAIDFLDQRLVQHESEPQGQTWMLHAIAAWRAAANERSITAPERRAFDDAFEHREHLTAYSRALLALTAHDFGDQRAGVLVRNLEDGVKIDRDPASSVLGPRSSAVPETMGTAHWGEDDFWWRWFDGPVESTAFALQALVRIDPQNRLIEPVMNWLVKNRRGAQWNNTRDTAIAILALNDYLAVSREFEGDVAYELSVNGRVVASRHVSASDILGAPSRFAIDAGLVRDVNEIRIRRTGGRENAPIYFAAEARMVSLEEPVKAAGNEIFVRRDYVRLAGRPTLLRGTAYDKEPLLDNGSAASGERVEVVVNIETKNDYDYLMFEDLKPAGLEAVALQSGAPLFAREVHSGRMAWVYQELRDRKVALFIDHLPQGVWEIRYTLRAEVPGEFHALPLLGEAMYVPEIRANGEEVRMSVK